MYMYVCVYKAKLSYMYICRYIHVYLVMGKTCQVNSCCFVKAKNHLLF